MNNRLILPCVPPNSEQQETRSLTGVQRNPNSKKPKRKIIAAACDACRKKKTRPQSNSYFHIELIPSSVQWSTSSLFGVHLPPLTLGTMLQVCYSLQSGSPAEVQATVAHIRNDPDFLAAVKTALRSSTNGSLGATTLSTTSTPRDIVQQLQHATDLPLSQPLQPPLEDSTTISFQSPPHAAAVLMTNATSSTSTHTNLNTSPYEGFLELPEKDIAYAAIINFYKCSGTLFHVFSREQGVEIWRAVYERGEINSPVRLAEMFGIIAIGSQYVNDETFAGLDVKSYHVAKSLLEDALEANRLAATKIIVCLAMYNIMNKNAVALSYIELGLSIVRRHGLHERVRSPNIPDITWWEMKRVWRTFMFLESWLTSTLGYTPAISNSILVVELLKEMEIPVDLGCRAFDTVQAEMTKVSILTARVVRVLFGSEAAGMNEIAAVTADLRQWHTNLALELHLEAVRISDAPPEVLVPINFIHMIYYGALMLIYRRVMLASAQRDDVLSVLTQDDMYPQVSVYCEDGMNAARSSATILGRLHDDNVIFKKCWLVIFHSFTAAVVILHDIARKLLRTKAAFGSKGDFTFVETCLRVLAFSAEMDPAAEKFLQTLQPYYDFLITQDGLTTLAQPSTWQLGSGPKGLSTVAQSLLELVCKPFGDKDTKRSVEPVPVMSDAHFSPPQHPNQTSNSILPPLPDRQPLPMKDRFRSDAQAALHGPEVPHLNGFARHDEGASTGINGYSHISNGLVAPSAIERMGWSMPRESLFDGPPSTTLVDEPWSKRRKRSY
ncbi:hypothetical protein NA57DRAFT_73276 [Rhizodiscina lignyota]|uniref:Xylanolytic transcriptional activator regulatory domain-containing protein n=1 Tax=Rhizodiscina lignyota TaxID=1504668 RepID=A0A9P4IM98_9PEZI|nr:hypothetical protein NA57DRAFT_73276 [Rhizodiscina lignyota]